MRECFLRGLPNSRPNREEKEFAQAVEHYQAHQKTGEKMYFFANLKGQLLAALLCVIKE